MAKGAGPREAGVDPAKPRTRKNAPVAPAPAPAGAIPSRTIASPPDNLDALVKRTSWPASQTIHRIHPDEYAPDAFHPGPGGNARFSPIRDAAGDAIPTIYGGTTLECAAMETVFHDVPHGPGLKSVAKRKLRKHHYSRLQPAADLTLADLGSIALRKIGIPRVDLIDSNKDIYPQTRAWAEAIHAQCPDVQGLGWVSRQDDSARALILFEDRLPPDLFSSVEAPVDIVADAETFTALIELADLIGVKITGK